MINIYVGNLSYQVSEAELQDAFAQFGEVASVKIISDRLSGQSKGFGFVEMEVQAEAEEAIKQLDGASLKGRAIKVNLARPKSDSRPKRR